MRIGIKRRVIKENVFNGTYENDRSKGKKSYATVTPRTETNHERVVRQRKASGRIQDANAVDA